MDVKIPKDISKYKEKVIGSFSVRQFISLIAAFGAAIPFYYYFKKTGMNEELLSWITILIVIPVIAIGFFDYHGMNIEKFIFIVIRNEFIYPVKRKYRPEKNELEVYLNELEQERKKENKLSGRFNRKK